MKTGNGYTPNPKGTFKSQGKKETSNLVKPSTGKAFGVKKSALASKKR